MRLAIATWLRASERSSGTGVSYFDWAVLTPPEQSRNGRHCQGVRTQRRARRAAARREPSAVARGEGKDCLAKAPRCQQIARSAASNSENDSMEFLSS